jgi:hypothetical protein
MDFDVQDVPPEHLAELTTKYARHKANLARNPILWPASRLQLQNILNVCGAALDPARSPTPAEGWEFKLQTNVNGTTVTDTGSIFPGILEEVPLKLLYPMDD